MTISIGGLQQHTVAAGPVLQSSPIVGKLVVDLATTGLPSVAKAPVLT